MYLDFEGFEDQPPVLVGQLIEYEFEQVVVDERFNPITYRTGCKLKDFSKLIEGTIARCRNESRVLIGFTRHEVKVIERYTDTEVRTLYRDAHEIARRWVNRMDDGAVAGWSFDEFMEFIGFDKPSFLGDGKSTHRLRSVLKGLQARGKERYEDLTPVQKAKWTKLLRYNRVDCLGMRDFVLRAASEIAADA